MLRAGGLLRRVRPGCQGVAPRHSSAQMSHCTRRTLSATAYYDLMQPSEEVQQALADNTPVVALESTIISHGMPYPQNLETAVGVEQIVRDNGAVPATVAIMDGKLRVGLSASELEQFAALGPQKVTKASRRDIPFVLSQGTPGATTVAGTMVAAHLAGIGVFVTGGVGGVHRGAESSMDVSADLLELGRTPVAVVCAGVKSILDIGRTLEVLETQGVTVAGYQCTKFPAFFTASSPFDAPMTVASAEDAADVFSVIEKLGLNHGMLLAVPNPEGMDEATIEAAIETSLQAAKAQGITGKAETPFLLKTLDALTGGVSLASNIALVRNNARVGAEMAVALAVKREAYSWNNTSRPASPSSGRPVSHVRAFSSMPRRSFGGRVGTRAFSSSAVRTNVIEETATPVVVGGAVVDLIAQPHHGTKLIRHTSNPGKVTEQYGGVGRNIAECLAKLGCRPVLVTAFGTDGAAEGLLASCRKHGMTIRSVPSQPGTRTAVYSALLDENGDLLAAVADMDCFDNITPQFIREHCLNEIAGAGAVVIDGNLLPETIQEIVKITSPSGTPVWFEPTSVEKSKKVVDAEVLPDITVITPNRDEVLAMANAWRASQGMPAVDADDDADDEPPELDARAVQLGAEIEKDAAFSDAPIETHGLNDFTTESASVDFDKLAQGREDAVTSSNEWKEDTDDSDSEGTTFELDFATLLASQTVLAAMCSCPESAPLIDGAKHVLVTMGDQGVLHVSSPPLTTEEDRELMANMSFFEAAYGVGMDFNLWPAPKAKLVNCTGAGDTFMGTAVWSCCQGHSMHESIRAGLAGAKISVESESPIPDSFSPAAVAAVMPLVEEVTFAEDE